MSDEFASQKTALNSPANHAFAITPADGSDLDHVTRGIYVGGAGNLKVDMAGGETVTFTGLAVGVVHALRVKRVYLTGTTATAILGLY